MEVKALRQQQAVEIANEKAESAQHIVVAHATRIDHLEEHNRAQRSLSSDGDDFQQVDKDDKMVDSLWCLCL